MKFTGSLANPGDVSPIVPATSWAIHATVPGTGNVIVEYAPDDENWLPTGFVITKTEYNFISGLVSSPLRLRCTAVTGGDISYVIRTN